jgi:hypothetical protein
MHLGVALKERQHDTVSEDLAAVVVICVGVGPQAVLLDGGKQGNTDRRGKRHAWKLPEFGMSIYGATKAFVLFLSQGLSQELSPKGVYVQAVLPAATRTEIWARAGIDVNTLPEVMEVGELVDAALVGFDRRELVTIPPLHVGERWDALEGARQGLMSDIRQTHAAERYQRPLNA